MIGTYPGGELPTWAEWLTLSAEDLGKRLNRNQIPALRELAIGHARVFNTQWALTVGKWGVQPFSVIKDSLPIPMTEISARAFKHAWHLKNPRKTASTVGDPSFICFAVQKAILSGVGQEHMHMDWRAVALASGVLPIEAVLYDTAFYCMSIVSDMTPKALMKVSRRKRKNFWDSIGVELSPFTLRSSGGVLRKDVEKALCEQP